MPEEGRDILGRTYEYFIKEFARAEGHRGGEFFTPAPVARLLVEMLEPYEGRVLRSGVRLLRPVRAVSPVHRGPRRPPRQDLDLRPGAKPGHLADRTDEPRDPRPVRGDQVHAGRLAARRRFPDSEGGLRDGEPAVQPVGMVDPRDPRRRPLGARHATGGERELRAGSSTSSSISRRMGAPGS